MDDPRFFLDGANSEKAAEPKKRVIGRPWPKGVSGNPSGRPKVDRELTRALSEITNKQELAQALVNLAFQGDTQHIQLRAIQYIYDRIDGSPTQRHEVSHDDVVTEVRRMAKERGLTVEDTQRAVQAAEEMLARGQS